VREEERAGLATDNGFRQQVARLYGQMLVSRNDSEQAVAVWKEGYSWDTTSTIGKLLLKDSTEEHTGAK
jgi:predicted negative regulator of RcsB-dependent stress response